MVEKEETQTKIDNLREDIQYEQEEEKRNELFEQLAYNMNHIKTLDQMVADKEKEGDDLRAVHKQERAQEAQQDKQAEAAELKE